MLWKGRRASVNVEDRRGMAAGGMALGGGGLIVALLYMLLGGNPEEILGQLQGGAPQQSAEQIQADPRQQELKEMVSVMLADTEDVWAGIFGTLGKQYQDPTLVLFTGAVDSGCGYASSQVGPFYCPADHKLYLDLQFVDDLATKFHAPGDFPVAYVIAHEVGHHVQNLLGTTERYADRTAGAESIAVRMELQADFYAGVWAHYADKTKGVLQPGDIEEAIRAAEAIGDDALQKQAQGHVVPDSFTHGTSEQRMRWFMKGYKSGDVAQGDTFNARSL
jgi:predicted metalloprotease